MWYLLRLCVYKTKLPPIRHVKEIICASFIWLSFLWWSHPWSSCDPHSVVFMIPPIPIVPENNQCVKFLKIESLIRNMKSSVIAVNQLTILLQLQAVKHHQHSCRTCRKVRRLCICWALLGQAYLYKTINCYMYKNIHVSLDIIFCAKYDKFFGNK